MFQALLNKIYESAAKLLVVNIKDPLVHVKSKSDHEEAIINKNHDWMYYQKDDNIKYIKNLFEGYSHEDMKDLYSFNDENLILVNHNGITLLSDLKSKYYNVINHYRVNTNFPDQIDHNICVFGNCLAVGAFCEDKNTVSNFLQRKFNNDNKSVAVRNGSNWLNFWETCRQIISPRYSFNKNDIVVIITHDFNIKYNEDIKRKFDDLSFYSYMDISDKFQRPHDYGDFFIDKLHMTEGGLRFIADLIYPELNRMLNVSAHTAQEDPLIVEQINEYMSSNNLVKTPYERVGAIVMNANPFTKGHMFLTEFARKQVDYLYVFVVSEDKSFVSFNDRFQIVYNNLKHMGNVRVAPSGSCMISQITLPGYFKKTCVKNVDTDFSMDLNIFGKYIAPALGITQRFAGEEPSCPFTRCYNQAMSEILPSYNIKFIEIERYNVNHTPVSASLVRELINNEDKPADMDKLAKYLTKETIDYLIRAKYIQTPLHKKSKLNWIWERLRGKRIVTPSFKR